MTLEQNLASINALCACAKGINVSQLFWDEDALLFFNKKKLRLVLLKTNALIRENALASKGVKKVIG